MTTVLPKGPFCQSCGMPMEKPEDFGMNVEGFRNNDYCHFCFKDGSFTEPKITMEQMIEKIAGMGLQDEHGRGSGEGDGEGVYSRAKEMEMEMEINITPLPSGFPS